MKYFLKHLKRIGYLFAYLILLQSVSCINDDIPAPKISIAEDKIICEKCNYFGSIIEADGNDLVVADAYSTIFIFERQKQELKHIKTINFGEQSGIHSLALKDGVLMFGHPDADGTGVVYIYEKRANDWEKSQELTIGRYQDNFGNSIDFNEDHLVIGANAPYADAYNNPMNKDEGRAYIYKKTSSGWELDAEFLAIDSHSDDRFGETVAIQGNYILVGSGGNQFHIYRYDGEWQFNRTEPLITDKIVHDGSTFLAKYWNGNEMLISFNLMEDGEYEINDISFDFSNNEVSGHGEKIDIHGTHALFALEYENDCFLMEFSNNEWINITKIDPVDNVSCSIYGLEITDDHIYLGGDDCYGGTQTYVYIMDL